MQKAQVIKAIEAIDKNKPKRNFNQTFDLVISLQGVDLKKTQIDFFLNLPNKVKDKKVCGLVGPELYEEAKNNFDLAISQDEFEKYKEKKNAKKLLKGYDFFVAQANIMGAVAAAFGRSFGPKGKMPNPKAGCVVPPKANLKPVKEKLQKLIRVTAKQPTIQCSVGKEDHEAEKVAENVLRIYDTLLTHLPNQQNNVKGVYLKLTMSKAVKLE